MKEHTRYYCFKLGADSDVFRVRAESVTHDEDRRYVLRVKKEIVGEVVNPAAWWIEDDDEG
ncbi:MAG: hypothetical protein OXG95_06370 [Chloroflexi bacterium]|nr:hypothetical protein [Chloroflexota bacterium]